MDRFVAVAGDDPQVPKALQKPGLYFVFDRELAAPVEKDGLAVAHPDQMTAEREAASLNRDELVRRARVGEPPKDAISGAEAMIKDVNKRILNSTALSVGLPLGIVILCIALGFASVSFGLVRLADGATDKALSSLGALFVIALFVERAQEVYINAWRGLGKARFQGALERLSNAMAGTRDVSLLQEVRSAYARVSADYDDYSHDTRKAALLGGMLLGIVISFVGPRILADMSVLPTGMGPWQTRIFNTVDILITGGLIGGGSDGIHKLVSLVTDFLDRTRSRMNAAGRTEGAAPAAGA